MRTEDGTIVTRYDPSVHEDAVAYTMQGDPSWKETNLRRSLAIGGIFTPFTEELRKVALNEDGSITIPSHLIGTYPEKGDSDEKGYSVPPPEGIRIVKSETVFASAIDHTDNPDRGYGVDGFWQPVLSIKTPVGRFGDRLAYSVTQATRALYVVAYENMMDRSKAISKEHAAAISHYTFYKNPLKVLVDSINSTGQAFSVLTNFQRIPGYERDPIGLFKELVENDTLSSLARHLKLGRLALLNLQGLAFRRPIDPETLKLTKELKERLNADRLIRQAEITDSREEETTLGCPVARKNTPVVRADGTRDSIPDSGINLVADVFVRYVDHYYSEAQQSTALFL